MRVLPNIPSSVEQLFGLENPTLLDNSLCLDSGGTTRREDTYLSNIVPTYDDMVAIRLVGPRKTPFGPLPSTDHIIDWDLIFEAVSEMARQIGRDLELYEYVMPEVAGEIERWRKLDKYNVVLRGNILEALLLLSRTLNMLRAALRNAHAGDVEMQQWLYHVDMQNATDYLAINCRRLTSYFHERDLSLWRSLESSPGITKEEREALYTPLVDAHAILAGPDEPSLVDLVRQLDIVMVANSETATADLKAWQLEVLSKPIFCEVALTKLALETFLDRALRMSTEIANDRKIISGVRGNAGGSKELSEFAQDAVSKWAFIHRGKCFASRKHVLHTLDIKRDRLALDVQYLQGLIEFRDKNKNKGKVSSAVVSVVGAE